MAKTKICKGCSKPFKCGASDGQCWCMEVPPVKISEGEDCCCPDCIGDFYFEKGRMVFTEKYLLKRGYCCSSGCRHCPYGKQ